MTDHPDPFTGEEFAARQSALRTRMMRDGLDAILVSAPENIFYLSGYQTKAVFTFQFLLFGLSGAPTLFTRQMEAVNAGNAQASGGLDSYVAYQDDEDPLDAAGTFLSARLRDGAKVGIELASWTMPAQRAADLARRCGGIDWVDVSTVIDRIRLVKSAAELAALREAGRIGDRIADKAVAAVAPGRSENDLAALVLSELVQCGSEYPGSWPNIMSGKRTGQIHATWEGTVIAPDDHVMMEITGVRHRYHAPSMRTVLVGKVDSAIERAGEALAEAHSAAVAAMEPGAPMKVINMAAERVLATKDAGCTVARRSGYSLGIGFPPSWGAQWQIGLNSVVEDPLVAGMAFHVVVVGHLPDGRAVSIGCTVALGEDGPERLTRGGVFRVGG